MFEFEFNISLDHPVLAKVFNIIFLFASLTLIVIFLNFLNVESQFLKTAVSNNAIVKELDSDNGCARPVFEFEYGGKKLIVKEDSCSNPPEFSVGERVAILHDPNDPLNFSIDTIWHKWLESILFGVLALVFSLITAVNWKFYKPGKNTKKIEKNENYKYILTLANNDKFLDPTGTEINNALNLLNFKKCRFAILSEGENFIQCCKNPEGFIVEYKDAKQDLLYEAVGYLQINKVTQLFQNMHLVKTLGKNVVSGN